jgi:ABC-type dipeptide/oligopeptide/nickel transport system permease component
MLPVLGLVLTIVFAMARLIPGDPAVTLLGPGATDVQIAALRAQLNLDGSLPAQFLSYLRQLVHGDLGVSLKSGRPVVDEIMHRLPATLELSLAATLIALAVGIPLGVWSAVHQNGAVDHALRVLSLGGVSMPAFLIALILQLVFGIMLGWLPVSGRLSPFDLTDTVTGFAVLDGLLTSDYAASWDALRHLLLPALVLAAFLSAVLLRFVRNSMSEVLGQDYIRTARAKGLGEGSVLFVHGLRNALVPALTIVGLNFAQMLGGAILTETVFSWPGIGRYMFDAIRYRDYPVIQGTTLLFALMFMITSLLVDVLHGLADPRIRRGPGA